MNIRLPTHLKVGALLRMVGDAGGSAMVLAKGDRDAGGILVLALDRGAYPRFLERGMDQNGTLAIIRTGPGDDSDAIAILEYWQKRRRSDPDLWVIEVDVAAAERFVDETIREG